MFSPDIVGSDAFIEMPVSAQALYFHLAIRADDDGFVNPQITMRMVGANADDLRILFTKRYLLSFENGVVVIKHWRINNFIRKDRYHPTKYIEQKNMLRVKENMSYTFDEKQGLPISQVVWKSDEQSRLTDGQPDDNHVVNRGEVRRGKERLGKERETASLNFLKKVPESITQELSDKYRVSPKGIQEKATDLLLYCEQKGRVYKNYKSFLENALRKDKYKLQQSFPLEKPVAVKIEPMAVSLEENEKVQKIMKEIGAKWKK